ncbi:ribosome biogenesis GTPase YlqF [Chitinivorax sp. B]|uniref:ribosome biogenesis GTPase YlqF n=1 Tax=Chitinivorax sp. B TaxID=2502235 RepID=UPI0010FA1134|nr:ribosome biogenesis GTPase YlqF [Chitinivorax sp. B]
MSIQWFPGHMASARKQAAKTMALVDVVVEVVDARIPAASSNPMIHELRRERQRPCLKVLNKTDIADPTVTAQWLTHFQQEKGVTAVALSCNKQSDVARIPALAQKLAPHRDDNIKPLRLMIMGIPNVGKSTLMNAMVKRKVAQVGDQPAVTKSEQRIDISPRLTVYDTPGLLWPKIKYPLDGFMLAACHAVGTNAVMEEEVAAALGDMLLARYPATLEKRYGLDASNMDGVAIVEAVGKRRGCRKKGGELDLEKAALILLTDFRSGILGRISLETPDTRQAMMDAQVEVPATDTADENIDDQA